LVREAHPSQLGLAGGFPLVSSWLYGSFGVAFSHLGSVIGQSHDASGPEQGKHSEAGHLARSFKIMETKHFFGWVVGPCRASLARLGPGRTAKSALEWALSHRSEWPGAGRFGTRLAGVSHTVGEPIRLFPNRGGSLRTALGGASLSQNTLRRENSTHERENSTHE
jgi:hypothetical protein